MLFAACEAAKSTALCAARIDLRFSDHERHRQFGTGAFDSKLNSTTEAAIDIIMPANMIIPGSFKSSKLAIT